MTINAKARALREQLAKGAFILAPGISDGISARVADGMGFAEVRDFEKKWAQ